MSEVACGNEVLPGGKVVEGIDGKGEQGGGREAAMEKFNTP